MLLSIASTIYSFAFAISPMIVSLLCEFSMIRATSICTSAKVFSTRFSPSKNLFVVTSKTANGNLKSRNSSIVSKQTRARFRPQRFPRKTSISIGLQASLKSSMKIVQFLSERRCEAAISTTEQTRVFQKCRQQKKLNTTALGRLAECDQSPAGNNIRVK